MIIIAHRAQDQDPGSIPVEYGIELDVRSGMGVLCLSHDPVTTSSGIPYLFYWLGVDIKVAGVRPVYAFNIKEDGIEAKFKLAICQFPEIHDYFVFDMSYPSLVTFRKLGVPFAERASDEESYLERSHRVWLDRWDWNADTRHPYTPLLLNGKKVELYAVSPELHISNCQPTFRRHYWNTLGDKIAYAVCTDHWVEAKDWFRQIAERKLEAV